MFGPRQAQMNRFRRPSFRPPISQKRPSLSGRAEPHTLRYLRQARPCGLVPWEPDRWLPGMPMNGSHRNIINGMILRKTDFGKGRPHIHCPALRKTATFRHCIMAMATACDCRGPRFRRSGRVRTGWVLAIGKGDTWFPDCHRTRNSGPDYAVAGPCLWQGKPRKAWASAINRERAGSGENE